MVELVHNHVLTETKSLIQTFSIQPDSQADGICSLIVASVNSAINLGTVALGTWGQIPGAITSMVSAGVSVVQSAASVAVGESGGPPEGTVAEEAQSDKTDGDAATQDADLGTNNEHAGQILGLDGIHDNHVPAAHKTTLQQYLCASYLCPWRVNPERPPTPFETRIVRSTNDPVH
jgi:hypothetical protein